VPEVAAHLMLASSLVVSSPVEVMRLSSFQSLHEPTNLFKTAGRPSAAIRFVAREERGQLSIGMRLRFTSGD
jgi:hypothetical protein